MTNQIHFESFIGYEHNFYISGAGEKNIKRDVFSVRAFLNFMQHKQSTFALRHKTQGKLVRDGNQPLPLYRHHHLHHHQDIQDNREVIYSLLIFVYIF